MRWKIQKDLTAPSNPQEPDLTILVCMYGASRGLQAGGNWRWMHLEKRKKTVEDLWNPEVY